MTARTLKQLPNSFPPETPTGQRSTIVETTSDASPADAFVVDDEDGICKFVSMALASLDLTAESYRNASQAIDALAELKLDRGIVDGCATDARNAGICRAVIALAHQFGVAAVAEGLENIADVYAIRDMGCDIGQGYVLARPMPKSSFLSLAVERARTPHQWLA